MDSRLQHLKTTKLKKPKTQQTKDKMKTPTLTLLLLATLTIIATNTAQAIQVSGNSSVYTFNITCQTDTPSTNCAPATINYKCQIDNPAFINYVEFLINNTWHNTSQNVNNFTLAYNKPNQTTTTNTTINLTQQKIHDTSGGYVNAFEQASVTNDCAVCTPTITIIQACNTTNQQIVNLTYAPTGCQNDTVTEQACIYCTPTWLPRTGGAYDCQPNMTKLQYYDDYSTCCALSPTNCIYPSDHNTIIPCSYLTTDMTCQYDTQPYKTNKINFNCELPTSQANKTFNCITYVRKENQTLLIQSNPEMAIPSMLLFWKETEARTSFTNTGRVINAYYTDKLLETGQEFILGMKCSSATEGALLTSEYSINPPYKPPTEFINRLAWVQDNWAYTIVYIIVMVTIILLIGWTIKKIRGR